ncbi:MAG: hypothetical protein Q8K98_02490 [Bacteroidota bacterium]|nr:hypothetical protein [Bacteroidota bacterium]
MSQIVVLRLRLEKYIVSNEFFNISTESVYLSLLIVYKPIDCKIVANEISVRYICTMKKLLTGLLVLYLIVLLAGLSIHVHADNLKGHEDNCPACLLVRTIHNALVLQQTIIFILQILFGVSCTILIYSTPPFIHASRGRAPPFPILYI